ncbi:MAG TPA: hypothetical protein VML94_02580 [Thermoplasmata archaeon]|nr:hypothetical protein [Thermoplasmata archaeon]
MGATVMVVVGLLAAFGATASAAPVHPDGAATVAWAYGGTGGSNGTITIGALTASWSASVSVVVILTATPTVANTTELEEQRTIGVTLSVSVSGPNGSLAFNYKAMEADTGYANITNDSTVYVAGSPVPALGLDNSSFHGVATLAESLVAKSLGQTASAYLNVSAVANAAVQFTPALGLIPLNLSDAPTWNSSANASPAANWNISYNYALHGWNNTNASGGAARNGSWTASGPVYLTGHVLAIGLLPHFRDHVARLGIVLAISGPAHLYEGFLVVPRGFDLFGGAHHDFSEESMANVTISGDTLFVNSGHVAVSSMTASETTVGGAQGAQPMVAPSGSATSVPDASTYGASAVAQPESVAAAQSQSHCIQFGCSGAGPWFSGLAAAAVIGGLIAAVAGTVGVVEWRSYARRKNQARQLVGGYSEGLASGFPPAAALPPTPRAPTGPTGPANSEGPDRQP